jgi:hypothetical protein
MRFSVGKLEKLGLVAVESAGLHDTSSVAAASVRDDSAGVASCLRRF